MKISAAITAFALAWSAVDAKTFLFPVPQTVNWTGASLTFSQDFKIIGAQNQHLQEAAKRYTQLILNEKWVPVQVPYTKEPTLSSAGVLKTLTIAVKDNAVKLDMDVDEAYTLEIPPSSAGATLRANTWVGALRGLETFSQLVESNQDTSKPTLMAHTATIQDSPSFGHRGVLLDTSRNFFSVASILRTLDAMAYNKMNVLHWHATDSQSWPLYFKSHPELSAKGAYSSKEVYSPQDVQSIISYAEARGVRVVVEIDMPAHTASIGESHPDFTVCRDKWWGDYAAEPAPGQLNPIHPGAWQLVQDLVREATQVFPDTLYHAGGDELNAKCWPSVKSIADHVAQRNITFNNLWFEWETKVLDLVKSQKKRAMVWEDSVRDGANYPKDTVVQTWVNPPSNYTAAGYDVVISNYDYFYLDCGHGGWVGDDGRYTSPTQQETDADTFNYGGTGGSWCSPFKTWQRIYTYDMTYGVGKTDKGKILGGEVALWSEQSNENVLDGRLWPRASAAAEIYWSGSYDTKGVRRTLKEVQPRFNDWVYRLMARGLKAEPIQPKWCAKHPQACDLNDPSAS